MRRGGIVSFHAVCVPISRLPSYWRPNVGLDLALFNVQRRHLSQMYGMQIDVIVDEKRAAMTFRLGARRRKRPQPLYV